MKKYTLIIIIGFILIQLNVVFASNDSIQILKIKTISEEEFLNIEKKQKEAKLEKIKVEKAAEPQMKVLLKTISEEELLTIEKKQKEVRQKALKLKQQKNLKLKQQKNLKLKQQKNLKLKQQKALELQKQKDLELQKQKDLELQKQKDLELQKQKDLEANNQITSLDIIKEIQGNLITKQAQTNQVVAIQKGAWTEETLMNEKNNVKTKISEVFDITVGASLKNKTLSELKNLAFKAFESGEYEIAIKICKEILQIESDDDYTKLSLAIAYQNLKQYRQAKNLYINLIKKFPTNDNIVSNLFAIIINESPYEAIYLLPQIAENFPNSPAIYFQLSFAFSKVKQYNKAIEYIKQAIKLEPENIIYLYNLAVLYDLSKDFKMAKNLYNEVLRMSEINNNRNLIPYNIIINRINIFNNAK